MMTRAAAIGFAGALTIAIWLLSQELPAIGAGGLLHPGRRRVTQPAPSGCSDREFAGRDVTLRGWACTPSGPVRGTVVYLHGIADNRESAVGSIRRFLPRGFSVIAYDSRANGESEGVACTY